MKSKFNDIFNEAMASLNHTHTFADAATVAYDIMEYFDLRKGDKIPSTVEDQIERFVATYGSEYPDLIIRELITHYAVASTMSIQ